MPRGDIRTLRDAASAAAGEGKHRKALECYLELEQLEPREPNWPKRAAETYRRLNKNREAIAAYDRAAERFVQGGFLVQAIAVCKVILQIDPAHEATKQRLAQITEAQDSTRSQAGALADRHRTGSVPVIGRTESGVTRAARATDAPRAASGTEPPRSTPPRAASSSEPPRPGAPAPRVRAPTPVPLPRNAMTSQPLAGRSESASSLELDDFSDTTPIEIEPTSHIAAPPAAAATIDDFSLDEALFGEAVREGKASDTQTGSRKPRSGPLHLDPGAPLDSVALAPAVPGAQAELRKDGTTSGIFVIPIDEDPSDEAGDMPAVEIETMTVGPDSDGGPELQLEPSEDPVELAVEDLEEIPDLAEPRAYSAGARKALASTPLFAALPPAALEELIDRMTLVELAAGEVLFRQGDRGDTLFVVAEGGVVVISEGPPRQELTRMGPGAFFGEVALVTEEPRSATIIAESDTLLLAIGRDAVRMLVGSYPDVLPVILRFLRDRLVDRLVKTHALFSSFAEHDRAFLVAHFRFLEIEAGAVILENGGRPAGLYALLAGRADVVSQGRTLTTLRSGDLFGEGPLLSGKPSSVTVTATVRCLALCLPAADFRDIIMTHPQVLSYIGDLVDERQKLLSRI